MKQDPMKPLPRAKLETLAARCNVKLSPESVTILYRYGRHDTWSERIVTRNELAAELLHFAENGAEVKLA